MASTARRLEATAHVPQGDQVSPYHLGHDRGRRRAPGRGADAFQGRPRGQASSRVPKPFADSPSGRYCLDVKYAAILRDPKFRCSATSGWRRSSRSWACPWPVDQARLAYGFIGNFLCCVANATSHRILSRRGRVSRAVGKSAPLPARTTGRRATATPVPSLTVRAFRISATWQPTKGPCCMTGSSRSRPWSTTLTGAAAS